MGFVKMYYLMLLLENNCDKWGIVLDGKFKYEDINLVCLIK